VAGASADRAQLAHICRGRTLAQLCDVADAGFGSLEQDASGKSLHDGAIPRNAIPISGGEMISRNTSSGKSDNAVHPALLSKKALAALKLKAAVAPRFEHVEMRQLLNGARDSTFGTG
jgi:hypothetical protein